MKTLFIVLLASSAIFLSGCATIFIPKRQKVTINTGQSKSIIYVDKEEFGEGSCVNGKVKKDGSKQVVIKTPGYKDTYAALLQTHRPIAFYPLAVLESPLYYCLVLDLMNPKLWSFNKINDFKVTDKLVTRAANDKYITISNIRLNIKNAEKDIASLYVKYSPTNLNGNIEDAEKKKDSKEMKAEIAKMKKKKKKGKSLEEDNNIKYSDIKYSDNVYKTLKNTGFIDTVNRVFRDNNNTLVLEGSIKKIYIYRIYKKENSYHRTKLFMTWYVKNTYDEIIDSVEVKDMSGDFVVSSGDEDKSFDKMFADAVDISYLRLHKNPKLTKYLKQESNFDITETPLSITKPKSIVSDKTDAGLASVIVKTKDGHGSGFAISNDGYIITNYHVVAGKFIGKLNAVKILTSEGEELEGTVVRTNKYRDLALVKVNKTFEKAFMVPNVKGFRNLQEVLTIGAPKSIELGQSVSSGVISNERKANNNYLLQLGMSVNGGNSGGPLYDASGKLHGVIVSKLVGENTEGVSFAIPSHMLEEYLKLKIN